MKAYPRTTAITPLWPLHTDGADACLDFALREMTVAYESLPSLGIVPMSVLCQEHGDFDLNRLG
jgi:hypothetical protein